jgi:two-component system nitrogen regulation response regulator NtrX
MAKARILIIDDEKNILITLSRAFSIEGYDSTVAGTGEIGLEKLRTERVDLVLLDVRLPGSDGIETLKKIRSGHPEIPVIMMSGHGTIETAVQATRLGAVDFLEKPLSTEKVILTIENTLHLTSLKKENLELKKEIEKKFAIVGETPVIKELLEKIRLAAPTNGRVLITGEHGTGKELVARAVHNLSKRAAGPFIKVNCAAIPSELIESELFGHEKGAFTGATRMRPGKFELAHRGTIFLDEIADMRLEMQAKLLRVLQEGELERVGGTETIRVDVRVIAATNKNLERAIEAILFREDLYYRLNVIPIHVPPLRDRRDDIRVLADYFTEMACRENDRKLKTYQAEAVAALENYGWPGNVRELKNIVERLVILVPGSLITKENIVAVIPVEETAPSFSGAWDSSKIPPGMSLHDIMAQAEKEVILYFLERNGWHISRTSEQLSIERSHLYKKMRQFGIERKD